MCRMPSGRAVGIHHEQRGDRPVTRVHRVQRLAGQRVRADGARRRVMTSRDPAGQQVGAHGAAQIAVGDDADQPARRHRPRRGSRSASRSSAAARGPSAVSGGASGIASPVCIRSRTRRSRAPSRPPGWNWRKSAAVKPRRVSSATASASPSAICMVVEVVGARPIGQASARGRQQQRTSAARGQRRIRRAR